MAEITTLCGDIWDDITLCGQTPSTPGIEDMVYLCLRKDVTLSYADNDYSVVTGITFKPGKRMYKIESAGDSFDDEMAPKKGQTGPRYAHTVTVNAPSHNNTIKSLVQNGLIGRYHVIVLNNDRDSDAAIELFGAKAGLQLSEKSMRKASDTNLQGGWPLEFTNPKDILEPFLPASVMIAPTGNGAGPATYASTIAALEAYCVAAA